MPQRPPTGVFVSSLAIWREGKLLFVNEPSETTGRKLNLPGGHVEARESPLEGAIREAKEETGFDVEIDGLLGAVQSTWNERHSIRFIWEAHIVGGEAKPEEDCSLEWLSKEEYKQATTPKAERLEFAMEIVKKGEKIDANALKFLDMRG